MKKKDHVKGLGKFAEETAHPSPAETFVRIFAASVRRARDAKGISQTELAKRLGTSQSAIARFEAGEHMNPSITFVCELAEALGMKIGYRPFLRKPGAGMKINGLVFDEWIEGV
jgi:transcriptional regulator with XRE-family HTH domain